MPERPDLDYLVGVLRAEIVGQPIVAFSIRRPVVLRLAVEGDPAGLLNGRVIVDVARRSHFVIFELDATGNDPPLQLIVSPMIAGRFSLGPVEVAVPGDLALAWTLGDGRQLRYRDERQMGKVYLVRQGDWRAVPGLVQVGVDVLDPAAFTPERFRALARGRRDQVRVFLMDKRALDALGNAYADEVLWQAGLHPKTWVRALDDAELDRLHRAIVDVLGRARDEVARRRAPIEKKIRDFLVVRGRAGKPCPRCRATIRRAGVRGHDAFFCPECQPDRRRSAIVDWRRLPKRQG